MMSPAVALSNHSTHNGQSQAFFPSPSAHDHHQAAPAQGEHGVENVLYSSSRGSNDALQASTNNHSSGGHNHPDNNAALNDGLRTNTDNNGIEERYIVVKPSCSTV